MSSVLAYTYLLQSKVHRTVQSAQCVQGCVKDRSSGLEGLFNFHVQEADDL